MKEIILKNGGITLIDDEFFDELNSHKWYLSKAGYVIHGEKNRGIKSFAKMHRVIMKEENPNIKIDHINGIKTDNQRSNLRLVTPHQNAHNSKKRLHTKNTYKGVNYMKKFDLYQSRCRMNGFDYYLGLYKTEISAAYAYNKKASEISQYVLLNNLSMYDTDYLEKILISERVVIKKHIGSKYKYICFKKKTARMKCDKYFIRFFINKVKYYKGYFFTELHALEYLIKNYSHIIKDAGTLK